jgi:pimeloyl-ACP methyl ester carboxylesterase
MNRLAAIVPIFLAGALCAGCRSDYYARKLIEHDTTYGKVGLTLTGTAEQLTQQKRIDLHRRIEGADKTPIDVWVIRGRQGVEGGSPAGTVVLIHGLLDSKATYLPLGQRLSGMGYDVVLPDLRAHGLSGGSYVTYGALEKRDIKAVMDSLLGAGEVRPPVYAFGVSLGAAVAIQYAAMEPRCKGVMAMAPYKDAGSITRRMIAFLAPMMSNADFQQTLDRAGKIARFDPNDASALQAIGKLNCPILLVHGLLDTTVPVEHSQALYDAAREPKQLIIVPWAGHASLLLAREAWIAEQIDTLAKTGLKKQASPPKEEEQ